MVDAPKKVLIIQLKRAGDLIVTTPVFGALKRRFPGVVVHCLTEKPFAPLLHHHPDLDRIVVYAKDAVFDTVRRIRSERYDWIVDFQSSPRSVPLALFSGARIRAGYRVPFWGRFFNRSCKRPGGDVSVTDGKLRLLEQLAGSLPPAPERRVYLTPEEMEAGQRVQVPPSVSGLIVGLVPTHRKTSRRWHAESFIGLAKQLRSDGHGVWVFWGPGEEAYAEGIIREVPGAQRIPPTNFREMSALFRRCALVVTNDNGPMHLATASGTSTLTIYGPTDPIAWNPGGEKHQVIRAEEVSCLGCNLNECPFQHECMSFLTVERVAAQCRTILNRHKAPVV